MNRNILTYLEDEMNKKKGGENAKESKIQTGIILMSPISITSYKPEISDTLSVKTKRNVILQISLEVRFRASKFKTLQNYIGSVRLTKFY